MPPAPNKSSPPQNVKLPFAGLSRGEVHTSFAETCAALIARPMGAPR